LKKIVYTLPGDKVAVMHLTWSSMKARTHGGRLTLPYPRSVCIENLMRSGHRPDFARRWIDTALTGGMTDAEYYEAVIEKAMSKDGTAPELVDAAPADRWFRDAWRRGHNGGPIRIDFDAARLVHVQRIDLAVRALQDQRERSGARLMLARELGQKVADIPDIRPSIKALARARSVEEVRSIWPAGLPIWPPAPASEHSTPMRSASTCDLSRA
jgi:hypothetical protein